MTIASINELRAADSAVLRAALARAHARLLAEQSGAGNSVFTEHSSHSEHASGHWFGAATEGPDGAT